MQQLSDATLDAKVGDLVANDFRYSRVFNSFGIDFCCGGGISLRAACEKKRAAPEEVLAALGQVASGPCEPLARVNSWAPSFLIDYIQNVHHEFVRQAIPAIRAFSQKVAKVHGHAQPELLDIRDTFERMALAMEAHLELEEQVLFPAIKSAADPAEVTRLVATAEEDHAEVGDLMKRLRRLSDDFTPPEWACNTYKALFVNLAEFEKDLHVHVHLENNVLFGKVGLAPV